MPAVTELETERLILRQWMENDYPVFCQLSADPEVMKFYPETLSEEKSTELANRISSLITRNGWGFWALEEKATKQFIGFTGLHKPDYELPFNPCIEVGWRLAREHWGKGYATEAAKAALEFAFNTLEQTEVVSFTSVGNIRSRAVMERLSMINTDQNFEHPHIPVNHPLREHVLYEITKQQWETVNSNLC